MMTNLTPDRINSPEEFQSYYKEVFDVIYTLDYLQGKAYLQLIRSSRQGLHCSTDTEQPTIIRSGTVQTVPGGRLAPEN